MVSGFEIIKLSLSSDLPILMSCTKLSLLPDLPDFFFSIYNVQVLSLFPIMISFLTLPLHFLCFLCPPLRERSTKQKVILASHTQARKNNCLQIN